MNTFSKFLEARGFQSDACESCIDPDFYRLAESLWEALDLVTESSFYGLLEPHVTRNVEAALSEE